MFSASLPLSAYWTFPITCQLYCSCPTALKVASHDSELIYSSINKIENFEKYHFSTNDTSCATSFSRVSAIFTRYSTFTCWNFSSAIKTNRVFCISINTLTILLTSLICSSLRNLIRLIFYKKFYNYSVLGSIAILFSLISTI